MKITSKGKVISPKAEERIKTVLAAIEQANPQVSWDNYLAIVKVRKFCRFRWLGSIFYTTRVFVDLKEDNRDKYIIKVPEEFLGKVYKKRPLKDTTYIFRFGDLEAKRKRGKIHIKMKGE